MASLGAGGGARGVRGGSLPNQVIGGGGGGAQGGALHLPNPVQSRSKFCCSWLNVSDVIKQTV